jgi:DNA-binding transcriptional ArsR family regulator/plastocyanin
MRGTAVVAASLLLAVPLAGCLAGGNLGGQAVREIDMWVEEREWELHPGETETVWAFCAEGDGVEPVHGEDPCGVPGPTIRVDEGDRIRLNFENTHTVAHTVHFHGWHEFEADMNGAEFVGEAMVVPPGEEQTIEWTAKPGGSFIYHCHHQTPTHMEKGMYGAFIVEDPRETDEPDVDEPLVLDEFEHAAGGAPGDTRATDLFTINGKSFPPTEPILADPGDRVRLRSEGPSVEPDAVQAAVANEHDRRILATVQAGEASAGDIIDATGIPKSTVYRRLERLEEEGLVEVSGGAMREGHPIDLYAARVDMVALRVEEGTIDAEWRTWRRPTRPSTACGTS